MVVSFSFIAGGMPGALLIWKQSEWAKSLSRVRVFAILWTVAHQAPPSMGLSRQEYWSGLPFPSPGDLPNPGIEPRSPALQTDALTSEPPGKLFFNYLHGCLIWTPIQMSDLWGLSSSFLIFSFLFFISLPFHFFSWQTFSTLSSNFSWVI